MRRALPAALVVGVVAGVATADVTERHMRLVRSVPAADTTVTETPSVVQLWFSQEPELSVSRISLRGEAGSVSLGDARGGEEKSLVADVTEPLPPGSYTVSWRTAGDDGHVLRRSFAFTVAPAPR